MAKSDIEQIIEALEQWRAAFEEYGNGADQEQDAGRITMRVLYEKAESLPESQQRYQLRGLKKVFEIYEFAANPNGSDREFYADPYYISDLKKLVNAKKSNAIEGKGKAEAIKNNGCWHNQDFTLVVWYGIVYTFNKKQGRCIQYLWENERASQESIGGHIDCSSKKTYRLLDTFRSKRYGTHEAWGKIIKPHGNGVFSLVKPKRQPTKNTP